VCVCVCVCVSVCVCMFEVLLRDVGLLCICIICVNIVQSVC